jgi:hypothetical protein
MAALDLVKLSDCVVNGSEPRVTVPVASSLLLAGLSSSTTTGISVLSGWPQRPELPKEDVRGMPWDVESKSFYTEVGAASPAGLIYCSGSELSWADLTDVLVEETDAASGQEIGWIASMPSSREWLHEPTNTELVLDNLGAVSLADRLASFVVRSVVNRGSASELVAALGAARGHVMPPVEDAERLSDETLLEQLRESSTSHARQSGEELLDDLALNRGLAWQTIATMLGVTSAAIRKWRRGGSVAPENRAELAALVAFFEELERIEKPIADLGSWIEMRVRDDTTLTPAEIYRSGAYGRLLLIHWTCGEIHTATMLDRFDSSWREDYAPDPNFRVGVGPDGERAIVPR